MSLRQTLQELKSEVVETFEDIVIGDGYCLESSKNGYTGSFYFTNSKLSLKSARESRTESQNQLKATLMIC